MNSKTLINRIADLIRSFTVKVKISDITSLMVTVSWQSDTTVDIEGIKCISPSFSSWRRSIPIFDRVFHELCANTESFDLDLSTCDTISKTREIQAVNSKIKKLCDECDKVAKAKKMDPKDFFEILLEEAKKLNKKRKISINAKQLKYLK
jgi:hypothetical protein